MRYKIFVIIILLLGLGVLIQQMLRIEDRIRSDRSKTLYISDFNIPLIERDEPIILKQKSAEASYSFRCRGDHFEYHPFQQTNTAPVHEWKNLFMKGVNLGVAMPGYYPAQFTLSEAEYYYWLSMIASMNANSVRLYTILPPEFYRAFARYNRDNAHKPLYLFQGVWAVVPEEENYLDEDYSTLFKREIRDAIDVIHGSAVIPERRGHASGVYVADVSPYVAGIILGREWEPVSVSITNLSASRQNYRGEFVSAFSATPMEVFLASMMDFSVLYETQEYSWQHPVSFVNWLTLDPLYHNSEFIEGESIREFDNDLETVDIRKFHASELFSPGIFSSYHVYPYYPDFIYFDQKYASDPKGSYAAYLEELKNAHRDIPLVIAEYGVPNSRGNSHRTPEGFDQGGHSELEHATINTKLTREIWQSGAAGAFYFEWFDEWFKHNWLVMDFEQPAHNRVRWHNRNNPEQNFGIIALEGAERILDGEDNDWPGDGDILTHADVGYFYIGLRLGPDFDFSKHRVYIAIDTHEKDLGDKNLPFKSTSERGLEFLLRFDDTSSAVLLVDDAYDIYTDILRNLGPPYTSKQNQNGIFVEQKFLSNRIQVSLTNDTMPAWEYNSSVLTFGKSTNPANSNSDWYYNSETGFLEIRIPWLGLNVGDPSSRSVFHDKEGSWIVETKETPGFHIKAFVNTRNDETLRTIPANKYYYSTWDTWIEPKYTARRKVLFDSLAHCFGIIRESKLMQWPDQGTEARISDYYRNYPGAISLVFGGNKFWYPQLSSGILKKYRVGIAFSLSEDIVGKEAATITDRDGYRAKRMGPEQLRILRDQGHDIIYQEINQSYPSISRKEIEEITHIPIPLAIGRKFSQESVNAAIGLGYEMILTNGLASILYLPSPNAYPIKKYEQSLQNASWDWSIVSFSRLFTGNESDTSFSMKELERYLRLSRNTGYWIAPPSKVYAYLNTRSAVQLNTEKRASSIFLTANLKYPIPEMHPITIVLPSEYSKVRISNSLSDGVHEVRNGIVEFDIIPGSQVIIENLKP